jgi:hypothetical protein
MTFDMLPDDALLEIFAFYVNEDIDEEFEQFEEQGIEGWVTLVHVCRRWRSVVFQSPRRLKLRLLCTPETRVRDTLDVWPALPLIIYDPYGMSKIFKNDTLGVDNLAAALEHNDRVCQVQLRNLTCSQMEYVADLAAMHRPFPQLTDLWLGGFAYGGLESILPNSFLGGTAPRLQSLGLYDVPFPGLPKLLSSATHLVDLYLNISPSGYIPPEAMATSLSALTSLESLSLHFRHPRPRPALERRRPPPPPPTRSILPSLSKILFKGASEYLEEILARIDAPRIDELHITFFNQIIFDTPQLSQFISRRPALRAPETAHIAFKSPAVIVKFLSQASDYGVLSVEIPCTGSEWQLSSLEQVCTSSLPPVSTTKDLYIFEDRLHPPRWQDDVENTQWLELLDPFAAVENLYLCKKFVPRIAPALQELVGARTTEVLPTLENIFLEGSRTPRKGIKNFLAARRRTSHPVEASLWNRNPVWLPYVLQ